MTFTYLSVGVTGARTRICIWLRVQVDVNTILWPKSRFFITLSGKPLSFSLSAMLTLSAVDFGSESQLGQTKDTKIGICCFSTKHADLRSKSTDWNHVNVSE